MVIQEVYQDIGLGDANQFWGYNQSEQLFNSGQEAKEHSIIVWNSSWCGHVAFVEAVDTVNNCIYISQAGGGQDGSTAWYGIERVDNISGYLPGYQLLGYIYLDEPTGWRSILGG